MSGLPNLPPGLPAGLAKYLTSLGQQFEVTQSERGSPLNAKPTIQDLIDIGLIRADATQALKANGKSFSLGAADWLSSAIPSYFTSYIDPPTPAGLVVVMNTSNIVLAWDPWDSSFYQQTIVYRASSNNLSAAVSIGSTTGTTYVDNLPPPGAVYYYWIRHQAKSGLLSDFNAVGGTTTGNVAAAPVITAVFDTTDLVLEWPSPTSALTILFYVVRYGTTFSGGVDVGTSNTNTLRLTAAFGGTRRFWVAAVDVNYQVGLAGYLDVTAQAPNAPTVALLVRNDTLVLSYSATPTSLPVAAYELRYGASWAAGTPLHYGSQNTFTTSVNWTGSRTFWVGAYDTAGNLSAITQVVFTPTLPSAVTVSPQVIDNNVLLTWTASTGTLSIAGYIVDRGGSAIGSINGLFSAIYETAAGSYTYGVTPVDSAGNQGPRTAVTATVSQPPDFVLYSSANSTFAGTKTNGYVDPATGALLCNVDTSETWATHFSSRGWTSIADQVAAGYSLYVVGKTAGQYQEVVNYGASIPSTKITMTPNTLFSSGSVSVTPELEAGVDGTTFPQAFPGVYSAYASSFQYVRYTLAFSATHDGTGLSTDTSSVLAIQPLNYNLNVKLKSYQGSVSALSTDSGGTVVDITGKFVAVTSIVLTAQSTTPLICVYDFAGGANPTQFKVLAFNTSGTRVSATVSYTLRGE